MRVYPHGSIKAESNWRKEREREGFRDDMKFDAQPTPQPNWDAKLSEVLLGEMAARVIQGER